MRRGVGQAAQAEEVDNRRARLGPELGKGRRLEGVGVALALGGVGRRRGQVVEGRLGRKHRLPRLAGVRVLERQAVRWTRLGWEAVVAAREDSSEGFSPESEGEERGKRGTPTESPVRAGSARSAHRAPACGARSGRTSRCGWLCSAT